MANQEHLEVLKQGTDTWNEWRVKNPDVYIHLEDSVLSGTNLSRANLSRVILCNAYLDKVNLLGANLLGANLSNTYLYEANLSGANLMCADFSNANLRDALLSRADLTIAGLSRADLSRADLSRADLSSADLRYTILSEANLSNANLSNANLSGANLSRANLSGANLSRANLIGAILVETNLTDATLQDCHIYGISAWGLELKGATQSNLVITPHDESTITIDNLEVAQFIYLLLNNPKIRDVIDTIAKKAVLILGRFTSERKAVLDALRDALREHNYLPILFDFEIPQSHDVAETIRTLAHLARFILADLTDPSSIPLELQTIIPDLEVPVQPLLLETKQEFSMFKSLRKYHWVLPTYTYQDLPSLLASLEHLLVVAERKADDIAIEKARRLIRP